MKKILSALFIAFCTVSLLAILGKENAEKPDARPNASALFGNEGMEAAGARQAWERQRLADPATGEIPRNMRMKELAFAANLPTDASMKPDSLTVPWVQRGPWNLGGRTRAFAMDVMDDNIMIAAGVSGGIWRTTNAGTDWTRTTLPAQHPGVNHLVQDTRAGKTDTWYALSGEAYGTSASGGGAFMLGTGMFKSTDNGLTWDVLSSTNSATPQSFDNVWDATWSVALDPSETTNDEVYASMIGAVMRSTDGGTSWQKVRGSNTLSLAYFTNVMVTPDSGIVYATLSSDGIHKGIWRSPDGLNWTQITPAFMPATYGRIVSCYNPLNQNQLYFLAADVDPAGGKLTTNFRGDPEWNALWRYTYLSGNGAGTGGKWENLTENIPAQGGPFDKFIVQGGYDLVCAVNPNDTNMVFIGGTNLYRSTTQFNDSLNTTHIGGYGVGAQAPELFLGVYPNFHPDHHVLFFHPNQPNVAFCGNDGGIYRTDDITKATVDWVELNNGYLVSQFYTVGLDHGTPGDPKIIGGLQDNGTYWTGSSVQTDPYVWVSGGDGAYLAIEDGGGMYYFSKQLGRIAKVTLDNTGAVTAFERIDPIGTRDYRFINPFVLDPSDQNIMYLPEGPRIRRNDNLGAIPMTNTWDSISTNWTVLPDTLPGTRNITAIGVSTNNPSHRLYVGTDDKFIYRIDDANTATPTQTYVTGTQLPTGGFVSCLAVHPDDGDKVIAVYSNYAVYSIWYSTDAGMNWSKVAGNLEAQQSGSGNGPSVRWAQILPYSDGDVYLVGTSTGLYATDTLDGLSTTWIQLGANSIGNTVVDMIDHRRSDGMTVIGTHGYGIWSATLAENAVSRLKDKLPGAEMSLYPNPVRGLAKITLKTVSGGGLTMQVLDGNGNQLLERSLGEIGPGTHEFGFSAEGFASGIYFCVVKGEGWQKTAKFLVR